MSKAKRELPNAKAGTYTALDLFAGCGGLSKGIELAGFNVVAANEFWEPASQTYKTNHENTKLFTGDITAPETKKALLDFLKNRKCDIIVGGPPCQAYSVAGLRDPNDPRGRLFEDYVDIVNSLRPKVFVMENVKGILTMKQAREDLTPEERLELEAMRELEREIAALRLARKQSKNTSRVVFTLQDEKRLEDLVSKLESSLEIYDHLHESVPNKIIRRFKKLGYRVEFRILNAADYGVPQKRERVIFIGTRFNVPILFPDPTHSEREQATLLGGRTRKWVTVREAIDDLKDLPEDPNFGHLITQHGGEFLDKICQTPVGNSVFGDYSDSFYRNPPDVPSRTIKENHGGVLVHYEKNRVMTPRELARLQSFKDDFIFRGTKSNILVQIGNAVPPKLGEAIGNSIRKMLENIEELDEKESTLSRSS